MNYLTTAQAAHTLGISRSRVHQLLQTGALRGEKVGAIWMVRKDSVGKRLEKQERGGDRPPR